MRSIFNCFLFAIFVAPYEITSQHTIVRNHIDLRNDPRLPINGTKNWEKLPKEGDTFSPRHSHATTVFKCPDEPSKQCLWLTGGYADSHRSFNLHIENELCDVWCSKDGRKWTQMGLHGDFIQGVGNFDAKVGGFAAPWFARYGHSLDVLDDVMILAGGQSPIPSNDVWISKDGIHWYFDGYAEWPKRAYHSTAVFQGKLFVMGGTPLSNSVWVGSLVKNSTREVGYSIKWTQLRDAQWTPRAGACAIAHSIVNVEDNNEESSSDQTQDVVSANTTEALFVLGGLAGFGEDNPDYEGIRTRNDVWKTLDGESWERVTTDNNMTVHWGARAFHGCTTWRSNYNDPTSKSKMIIAGGGYMGTKGNREVRSLETYTDTWWSYNGTTWMKINHDEGSKHKDNLYSTNEWTEITVDEGRTIYRGKWGFSLQAFATSHDLNGDGEISTEPKMMKECALANETICNTTLLVEDDIPALILIGGKVEGSSMVSDTFVSKPGIDCELNGITCGKKGTCGIAGCICHSPNFTGPYCMERRVRAQTSSSTVAFIPLVPIIVTGLLVFSL